jgi:hypothetical protein
MRGLGFNSQTINDGITSIAQSVKNSKNSNIYRLSYYSRHKLGRKFYLEAKKYINPQLGLFGDS